MEKGADFFLYCFFYGEVALWQAGGRTSRRRDPEAKGGSDGHPQHRLLFPRPRKSKVTPVDASTTTTSGIDRYCPVCKMQIPCIRFF
jgi:hypothetical protein